MMEREAILAIYEQGPEAVVELVQTLYAQLEAQHKQLLALGERVKVLEERLAKNSRNSSKPPSSDQIPPKPKSLRQKSDRKPGGQKGHPGKTLLWVEQPDEVVTHKVHRCNGCGTSLTGVEASDWERRQATDLPELRLEIVEHHAECKQCPGCGHRTTAAYPPGVDTPVGYGPRIKSLGVYLMQYQLLPYWRTSEVLSDLFGASPSVGTLYTAVEECFGMLSDTEQTIKELVQQASIGHFDETGVDISGKKWWLHVACTETLTHYAVHPKRGSEAGKQIGILPEFGGVAVHDGLYGYREYECEHALCNAHHLRELTCIEEQHRQGWGGPDEGIAAGYEAGSGSCDRGRAELSGA